MKMEMSFEEAWSNKEYRKILNSNSRKYRSYVDRDDLESEQMSSLWKCLENFDPNLGMKFSTYLNMKSRYYLMNLAKKVCKRKKMENFGEIDPAIFSQLAYDDSVTINYIDSIEVMSDLYPILHQRYIENLSRREIAQISGCCIATVGKKINSSLEYSKRRLENCVYNNEEDKDN